MRHVVALLRNQWIEDPLVAPARRPARIPQIPADCPQISIGLDSSACRCGRPAVAGAPLPCERRLRRGQHLFWDGDPAARIWSIRSGALKTYDLSARSEERVTGFFFAGTVIGWDAITYGYFRGNAAALESTVVVPVPISAILDGARASPQIQANLLSGLRDEFQRLNSLFALDHSDAEQKLAVFLLWVAGQQDREAAAPESVTLPMSRHDIGSYLGLAMETVSRKLTLFHRNGWITLEGRHMSLNAPERLQRLAMC